MSNPGGDHFALTSSTRSLKEHTIRGGVAITASQAVKFVLMMLTSMIMARLLTPADYGLVAMVTVITGFIANFSSLGLSSATIQRKDIDHDQVSTLFWVNAGVGAAFAVFTALLAPALSWFYGEPRLIWITIALAGSFVLLGLGVQHQALLNRNLRFGALAGIEVIAMLASSTVGIACAVSGFGYRSLVAAQLASATATVVLLWWFCRWRPGLPGRLTRVEALLRFGGDVTGFQFINYIARNGDNFLIGRFYGSRELGLYSRAYSLLLLPLDQIVAPIASVAVPALSKVTGEEFRKVYLRMLRVACVLTMPLYAFTIASAHDIILVFLGPQWLGAARIFAWLGVIGLTQPVSSSTGWLFVSQGHTRMQLRAGLVNGTLAVLSFLAGLPWGGIGVAAAYSLSGLLLRTPILIWAAARTGAVRARDFYSVPMPFLVASLTGLALTAALRAAVPLPALAGLVAGAVTTAVGSMAVLLLLPGGRQGLQDVLTVFRTLWTRSA